jgi:leucine dehydrogenase
MTFTPNSMLYDHPDWDSHEVVSIHENARTGMRCIIAIHDTRLGPALGGARYWSYPHPADALTDALRLSKGMTYKNAIADLPLGGGKSVLLASGDFDKTADYLQAFGQAVEHHNGHYITAEDVGMSDDDMEHIAEVTHHVRGTLSTGLGDPSPYTAIGVFAGIKAALEFEFGSSNMQGRRIAIQGLGAVGYRVALLCHEAGAKIVAADIFTKPVEELKNHIDFESMSADTIHTAEADVFAPCALGGVLNKKTIAELQAPIVAGAANNQLATPKDAYRLHEKSVLFAPDYVINAGGVISIALGKPNEPDAPVKKRCQQLGIPYWTFSPNRDLQNE